MSMRRAFTPMSALEAEEEHFVKGVPLHRLRRANVDALAESLRQRSPPRVEGLDCAPVEDDDGHRDLRIRGGPHHDHCSHDGEQVVGPETEAGVIVAPVHICDFNQVDTCVHRRQCLHWPICVEHVLQEDRHGFAPAADSLKAVEVRVLQPKCSRIVDVQDGGFSRRQRLVWTHVRHGLGGR